MCARVFVPVRMLSRRWQWHGGNLVWGAYVPGSLAVQVASRSHKLQNALLHYDQWGLGNISHLLGNTGLWLI